MKEISIFIKEDNKILTKDQVGIDAIEEFVLTNPKDTAIHIKSDKNAKFEVFVKVLDMLKKHEYTNISIVTKNEQIF